MDNRPIGFFDSGLGGLTCIPFLQKKLPNESIVYYGDTARTPYGSKSADTIKKFAFQISDYLVKNDVKMIVIACNTISATCLGALRERYPDIPVVGIIAPMAEKIASTIGGGNCSGSAAANGEASEGTAPGDASECETSEGTAPGDVPEGDATEGAMPEVPAAKGKAPEVPAPKGEAPEYAAPKGDAHEDAALKGEESAADSCKTAETPAGTQAHRPTRIGIIGTKVTIASGEYVRLISERSKGLDIYTMACPIFVPLIEEGIIEDEIMDLSIKHYMDDFVLGNDLDKLVLGCTHYPLIMKNIQRLYPQLELLNPSEEVVNSVEKILTERDALAAEKINEDKCFASDLSENFIQMIDKVFENSEDVKVRFKTFSTLE